MCGGSGILFSHFIRERREKARGGGERSVVHVGTSGWAYTSWKPKFYPEDLAQKRFLQYYSTQLNSVEVNYTFRQMLKETTINTWVAETPPTFRFAVKAHQAITHYRRLKDPQDSVRRFVESVTPLEQAQRLGPVLFQLPPNLHADLPLLRDFLATLPKTLRSAFEFRHESWFSDAVYDTMSGYNAALCIAENEELTTPDVKTADFSYYRFRKPEYGPDARQAIAARLHQAATGREVFAYFKHEEDPESAVWAHDVLRRATEQAA